MIKKCVVCQKEFETRFKTMTCSEECKKELNRKKNNEWIHKKQQSKLEEDPEAISCKLCGHLGHDLMNHIRIHHSDKVTLEEYLTQYGDYMSPSLRLKKSESVLGEKNPGYQHGGKLSSLSDNFIGDKTKKKSVAAKISKSNKENGNTPTTLKYWLNQGFSKQEAIEKLSERQTTFSLEKCVERFGPEEGKKRWEERQKKWLATMDAKSPEEKENIRLKKILFAIGSQSKAEKLIYEEVKKFHTHAEKQFTLGNYRYDLRLGNKLIEYNGDYWHCNPKIYKEDYFHKQCNKTAKEIWIKDYTKIKYAHDNGFKVLAIWESDFNKNPEKTIKDCVEFLIGTNKPEKE